jgi:hypothetical protein
MNPDLRLTDAVFWASALVVTLVDVAFVALLGWRIKRETFQRLRWALIAAGTAFWCGMGVILVVYFWEGYYQFFWPGWMRSGGFLLITLPTGVLVSYGFYWLALRLPGNPAVTFCLLGGVESIFEHLWGIYGFGILKIPLMQGVGPLPVLAFAVPEYIFYWGIILALAVTLSRPARSLFRLMKTKQDHL